MQEPINKVQYKQTKYFAYDDFQTTMIRPRWFAYHHC